MRISSLTLGPSREGGVGGAGGLAMEVSFSGGRRYRLGQNDPYLQLRARIAGPPRGFYGTFRQSCLTNNE
jgi:hypothetical protein